MRQCDLVSFLDELKTKLMNNSLSSEQKILLTEMFIKNEYLSSNDPLPNEEDMTKYTFLGWYIYSLLGSRKTENNI